MQALGNIFGKNNKTDRKRPSLSIWGLFELSSPLSLCTKIFFLHFKIIDLVLKSVMQFLVAKMKYKTQ